MDTQVDLQWIVEGHYHIDAFNQLAAEVGQYGPVLSFRGATFSILDLLLDTQCFDALEVILRANPTLELAAVRRKAEDQQLFRVFHERHLAQSSDPDAYLRVATLFPLKWLLAVDSLAPFLRPEFFVASHGQGRPHWAFPAPSLAAAIDDRLEAEFTPATTPNLPFLRELEWVALHVLTPERGVDLRSDSVRNADAYLTRHSRGGRADLQAELIPDRLQVRALKAQEDQTEVALVYLERGGYDLVSDDTVLRAPVGEWVWSSPAPAPGKTLPWAARTWF